MGLLGACWEFRAGRTGVEVRELRCDRRDAGEDMLYLAPLKCLWIVRAQWRS